MRLLKIATCEFLGTAFLLATVVGSGILGHNLDSGTVALTVLIVAIATGCVLSALILTFGSISAHFNPVVTTVNVLQRNVTLGDGVIYVIAQISGAIFGVTVANLMFDLPAVVFSHTARTGSGQWLAEFVATFGLIAVIQGCGRFRPAAVPFAVSAYVAGAILFTASTCFANPAVTISRIFTDTITGIRVADVVPFIVAQLAGGTVAYFLTNWLFNSGDSDRIHVPDTTAELARVKPHQSEKDLAGTVH
jgi:glycerol uptake facilitator-like aquaporin